MKKMLLIICIGFISGVILGRQVVVKYINYTHKKDVRQKLGWFYDGEVLYPDYVTPNDTLIVTRANCLNKIIASPGFDATDQAISNALCKTTVALQGRVLSLPKEYNLNNKIDNLSTVITKDSINIYFQ